LTEFNDRRVLITAGASGIGKCIADAFLAQGARVHVADVDAIALSHLQRSSSSILASIADVSDEAAVDALFEKQVDAFDGIDCLINCAGIKGPTARLEDVSLADWRRCHAVNLDATFLCSRRALPLMRQTQTGLRPSIVNISSTAGWHGYPQRSAYSSAKWAVIGLTKSLAMEVGEDGIRVNVICPGTVEGERMLRVVDDESAQTGVDRDDILDAYRRACSMRELIQPEDIAAMALFLCSAAAARITGQIMNVDGHLESHCV
jgi:NAD(P)-dependent dehydrogenase (short-subunit alcohol dehydrogenase family)